MIHSREWVTPSTHSESIRLGRLMACCLGNHQDEIQPHVISKRVIPHYLVQEDQVVAAALLLPQWRAVFTIAAYRARPLNYGEFASEFCHLLNINHIQRVHDVSVQHAGFAMINHEWVHLSELRDGLTVNHSLSLSNYRNTSELPKRLTICGDLTLAASAITHLPYGLKVTGTLDIRSSNIVNIPLDICYGRLLGEMM